MTPIRRSPSPIEYTGARLGLSAGISPGQAGRNPHAAQSRARAHRCNTQGFEWLPWRLSTSDPAEPPTTRAPSPLKTTALRVIRRAGYPHGQESAGRQRVRPGRRRRPAFRAGRGSSVGRALMLTVAALRVIGNAGYPHERESAEPWRRAWKRHRAGGIPSQKRLIGRSSADADRRSTSSNPGRRISTWARVRRTTAGARTRHRAGIPCQKQLIGRSSADAHRRNTQCRESFRLPDIHTGARAIFAHMLACEPDVHDASGDVGLGLGGRMIAFWCADRLSRVDARLCGHVESLANAAMRGKIGALQTIPPRSPLECTALRVAADAGISTSRRIRGSATMRAFG